MGFHQCWLNEVQLLPLWAGDVYGSRLLLVIVGDEVDHCLRSHGEDRMLRWYDFPAIDAQEDISWPNAGEIGSAAGVDILENPPLSVGRVVFKVACAQCGTT